MKIRWGLTTVFFLSFSLISFAETIDQKIVTNSVVSSNIKTSTSNLLTASEILEKADRYRGYDHSFQVKSIITSYKGKEKDLEMGLTIFIKDKRSSLVRYDFPAIDRNKLLLMVDENVWFYNSKSHQPIRLSPRQRLLGNASNADIARTNFSYDYYPEILKEDLEKKISVIKLVLRAKNSNIAYSKLVLTVIKGTCRPLRSEFYSASGKLLKVAVYKDTQLVSGEEKLHIVEISDALLPDNSTVIEYKNYEKNSLPAHYFNVEYMPRIQL